MPTMLKGRAARPPLLIKAQPSSIPPVMISWWPRANVRTPSGVNDAGPGKCSPISEPKTDWYGRRELWC